MPTCVRLRDAEARTIMSKVAFIGLGAMGSRMAFNLLKAGHDLTVWNRRSEAADTLVESGAKVAKSPRNAAEGNDFVAHR
jgi:3-hydroxyisobutyrate dehydrogenase